MFEREKTVISSMAPELALLTTGVREQLQTDSNNYYKQHMTSIYNVPVVSCSYHTIRPKKESTSQNSTKIHWILQLENTITICTVMKVVRLQLYTVMLFQYIPGFHLVLTILVVAPHTFSPQYYM